MPPPPTPPKTLKTKSGGSRTVIKAAAKKAAVADGKNQHQHKQLCHIHKPNVDFDVVMHGGLVRRKSKSSADKKVERSMMSLLRWIFDDDDTRIRFGFTWFGFGYIDNYKYEICCVFQACCLLLLSLSLSSHLACLVLFPLSLIWFQSRATDVASAVSIQANKWWWYDMRRYHYTTSLDLIIVDRRLELWPFWPVCFFQYSIRQFVNSWEGLESGISIGNLGRQDVSEHELSNSVLVSCWNFEFSVQSSILCETVSKAVKPLMGWMLACL